jgi:3-oxoacyl-[acyl-carrier-protein] synthase-1
MALALKDAGIRAKDVDYLQLHGTGTRQNDAMESKAVQRVFERGVSCSSSKPQFGHTLGAAGALGAAACWLALSDIDGSRRMPPHLWDRVAEDGLLAETLVHIGQELRPQGRGAAMANACAFGGNNVSLVLGRL